MESIAYDHWFIEILINLSENRWKKTKKLFSITYRIDQWVSKTTFIQIHGCLGSILWRQFRSCPLLWWLSAWYEDWFVFMDEKTQQQASWLQYANWKQPQEIMGYGQRKN